MNIKKFLIPFLVFIVAAVFFIALFFDSTVFKISKQDENNLVPSNFLLKNFNGTNSLHDQKRILLKETHLYKKFIEAKSYAVYYGDKKENLLSLNNKDIVIIDIGNFSVEDILKLKNSGVIVIQYISIGEFDGGIKDLVKNGLQNSVLSKNEVWNSYRMNPYSKVWRIYLNKKVNEAIAYKVDGVFLDTVDIYLNHPEAREGIIDIIRTIRNKEPELLLIQNNGMEIFEDTKLCIDGIMFEPFITDYDFKQNRYFVLDEYKIKEQLNLIQNIDPDAYKIFLLSYAPSPLSNIREAAKTYAKRIKGIFYISDIYLEKIYLDSF